MSHQKKARITLEMPLEYHKKLKALAAYKGISLKDLILNCVEDNILSKFHFGEELFKEK